MDRVETPAGPRGWEWLQLGVMAGMFAMAAVRWGSVPDRIPTHWNAAGEVDGYGGRFTGLLLLPVMTVAIYLLLRFLPRIDPAKRNYRQFAGAYLVVRVLMVVYMAFVYAVLNLAIGREESVPVGSLIIGAIGVMFIVLGVAMTRFRPNWFAGIRTPWTLTSELSWTKTHRLGGRVFVVAGVATLAGAVVALEWALVAMFAVVLPGVLWLVVYSYLVWRDDPHRVAAQDLGEPTA